MKKVIIKCTYSNKNNLIDYLQEEAVLNTFLIADILNYGFDKEFQTVWADFNGEVCQGVYLRFYDNLIYYSRENILNVKLVQKLFKEWKPDVIMGKLENIKKISEFTNNYRLNTNILYELKTKPLENECRADIKICKAVSGDEHKIHDFLMSIEQLKYMYASKQMIADRLKNKDGVHYYIEIDNELAAHANSTAVSPLTVMIGGVATAKSYRNNKLSSILVSKLCEDIQSMGKTPCLFTKRENNNNMFTRIGFEKAGDWGTLTKGV